MKTMTDLTKLTISQAREGLQKKHFRPENWYEPICRRWKKAEDKRLCFGNTGSCFAAGRSFG